MKKEMFDYLFKLMKKNKDIYLIFIGLGYPRLDEFQKEFGSRTINTEASEQTALDIAVGLAYIGKIPVVYTITPFYLRAFETIRTYINHEKLNVKMVGVGRDDEYGKMDGFSHDATDIGLFMDCFDNIWQYYPDNIEEMKDNIDNMIKTKNPVFINIHK